MYIQNLHCIERMYNCDTNIFIYIYTSVLNVFHAFIIIVIILEAT